MPGRHAALGMQSVHRPASQPPSPLASKAGSKKPCQPRPPKPVPIGSQQWVRLPAFKRQTPVTNAPSPTRVFKLTSLPHIHPEGTSSECDDTTGRSVCASSGRRARPRATSWFTPRKDEWPCSRAAAACAAARTLCVAPEGNPAVGAARAHVTPAKGSRPPVSPWGPSFIFRLLP